MDIASSSANPFAALGLAREAPEQQKQELGQEDFLRLMLAQLQNQDPLKPQSNGEFLGQMAQFGIVDGVQELNSGFADLGGRLAGEQTLSAAALLGRDVLVDAEGRYSGDGIAGSVQLDRPAERVAIEVVDGSGRTVRQLSFDGSAGGEITFAWDGRDSEGEMLPAADYSLVARAERPGGSEQLATWLAAPVRAVSRDGNNVRLELDGLPPTPLSDIRRIS
ncbi:flagellar hook assembly protein FlgD [Algiphilus aromaticivorans]|jgi:flagellar basal-body rod modification protein FlgD|uniref:flagellar hook assembly protein FlgD n=1 Tax=Algiphilus aromaticivorans TaxID=382454 RepID=UPI00069441DD|nr:flagellar hook capping FlgD N-terminal domain-containing protein [Algiphilus aromaticivorans]